MQAILALVAIFAAEETEAGAARLVFPVFEELIAGIIAFSIVFVAVWKFAWPRMNDLVAARQKAITGQLQEAEATKVEAQGILDAYKAQVAGAKAEGNEIVEAARAQAETVKAGLIEKADADAAGIVAKAREEAASEKARAMSEARQEVANLSIDLAEKVVGNSLDRDAQKTLVEGYLAELDGMST